MESKSPFQSRTLLASLLVAVAAFFPPAQAIVAANPGLAMGAAGAILAGFRLISSKKISF